MTATLWQSGTTYVPVLQNVCYETFTFVPDSLIKTTTEYFANKCYFWKAKYGRENKEDAVHFYTIQSACTGEHQ